MQGLIAVTGAAGFVGRAVVSRLAQAGMDVRGITRQGVAVAGAVENYASGDLLQADLDPLVEGCTAVINCAARVHVLQREDPAHAEMAYRRLNTDFAVALATRSKACGVRHFVQLSSAGAVAACSAPGTIITDTTPPNPVNPYGRSKLAADEELATLADGVFHVVSLRPPTVYGPGVGAFFALFHKSARRGLPLPLAWLDSRRSFIYSRNLADAVQRTLQFERSGRWLVTDGPALQVADLYRRLLAEYGYGNRVWPFPEPLLQAILRMALGAKGDSLMESAVFDGGHFARSFEWTPPVALAAALTATVGDTPE